MRKRGKSGSDKDRYLITYADLLTLLLGLFVVLYASSITDLEKYSEYKEALFAVFDPNSDKPMEGGEGLLDNRGNSLAPVEMPESKTIGEIKEELSNTLRSYFDNDELDMRTEEDGLVLNMNERLLFPVASDELRPQGQVFLDTLATVLKKIDNPVEIAGHCDNDPIRTSRFPSNWHLAAGRAAGVATSLFSRGVPQGNIKISSYGDQRPIQPNTNEQNKALNRRVEISISEKEKDTPISLETGQNER